MCIRDRNINEINELLKLIDNTNLGYVKLETNDLKLEVSKNIINDNITDKPNLISQKNINENNESESEEETTLTEKYDIGNLDEENLTTIESPLMGTFYASPGPDKDVFVRVGDIVNVGDTLCIVEAMKMMNEITSDIYGEIVEILVKNEELVEYNQPIFKIKAL